MQRLADQTGLTLAICHFPPGTSKWNKVEHRLFSFISSNWRDEPLRDDETAVRLIAGTTTAKGLTVTCRLDHHKYPVGRRITDEEFDHVNLKPNRFHGEWTTRFTQATNTSCKAYLFTLPYNWSTLLESTSPLDWPPCFA